jgi:hypothetical protein
VIQQRHSGMAATAWRCRPAVVLGARRAGRWMSCADSVAVAFSFFIRPAGLGI